MNASSLEGFNNLAEWVLLPYRAIAKAWKVTQKYAPDELWHMGVFGSVLLILWHVMQSLSGFLYSLRGDLVPVNWQIVLFHNLEFMDI